MIGKRLASAWQPIAVLALASLVLALPAAAEPSAGGEGVATVATSQGTVPRIILDTDFAADVDDVGAVAVLHGLADRGEVEIEATVVSSLCPWSPVALDAMNTWHGRGDLPIGQFTGDAESNSISSCSDVSSNFAQAIAENATYPKTQYEVGSAIPDAVDVYRQVLSDASDGSLTIVTVGFLTALSELLDSPADAIDPRSGADLLAAKVDRVIVMGARGGTQPNRPEYNLSRAPLAAENVLENTPVPITLNPWEIGREVITGTTNFDQSDHIVRYAYDIFDNVHWTNTVNGHYSWDLVTVLQAVRGNQGRFSTQRGTLLLNTSTGVDSWQPDPNGPHTYTSLATSPQDLEEEIEPLMWTVQGGDAIAPEPPPDNGDVMLPPAETGPQFVTTWDTNLIDGTTIWLRFVEPPDIPQAPVNIDVDVDWGDGTTTENVSGPVSHEYTVEGTYTVTVTGTFTHYGTPGESPASNAALVSVDAWGPTQTENLHAAFRGATNLVSVAEPPPTVTNMTEMFTGAETFNGSIGAWDVSNVTTMGRMFEGASAFNQDVGGWQVSNVTNMAGMFREASAFNQPIGNWDTGSVTNTSDMFRDAEAFDQSISSWDTSQVTDMRDMFSGASAFDQPIGAWETSQVTSMAGMFREAAAFDQDVSGWETGSVTNMRETFRAASAFDQPIGGWDTSQVTNMSGMFRQASVFDQPIGGWDIGNVADMLEMFREAAAFDQDISDWDTSNVTNMSGMFRQASVFDQPIGEWDTSQVTDMSLMFRQAFAFDRPIGGWDVFNVDDMSFMFSSAQAFDQEIGGWNVSSVSNMASMFDGGTTFNRDLSGWCVTLIGEQPNGFDSGALAWTLPRPSWGNCPDVPGAPADVVAYAADQAVTVAWSAPASDGGSEITSYTVTAQPGGAQCVWSSGPLSCEVTGLNNGDSHTFTVVASTILGDGPASIASAPVVPTADFVPVFVTTWNTNAIGGSNIELPFGDSGTEVDVDWGDGSTTVDVTGPVDHEYAEDGTYTVVATGTFESYGKLGPTPGSNGALLSVDVWQDTGTLSIERAFKQAANLTAVAVPPSTVTNMSGMFELAWSFNQDIGG